MKKKTNYGLRPVYFCPQCGSINTFTNEQYFLVCYECGYMAQINDTSFDQFFSHYNMYEL